MKRGPVGDDDRLEAVLATFDAELTSVRTFMNQVLVALEDSPNLDELVHSMRGRVKRRDHLRDKLERKMVEAEKSGKPFEISPENLLTSVTDLAGIRILHLAPRQIRQINTVLQQ